MKLLINNKKYEFFTGYTISLAYNSVASSFSFPALKEITNSPTDYPSCKVLDDDDNLLITGTTSSPFGTASALPGQKSFCTSTTINAFCFFIL